MQPPYPWDSYNAIVTQDAEKYPNCTDNVRKAWPLMLKLSKSSKGLAKISESMRLCDDVKSEMDVWSLIYWISDAFSFIAMGDYPYPSSYMTNGIGTLPAWPMSVACSHLEGELNEVSLLSGLASAAAVFYNHTTGVQCNDWAASVNNQTARDGFLWNFQYCTEVGNQDT